MGLDFVNPNHTMTKADYEKAWKEGRLTRPYGDGPLRSARGEVKAVPDTPTKGRDKKNGGL